MGAVGDLQRANPVGSLAPADGAPVPADKMFVQDMFPYPSGEGLHVGHPLGYIATDVYARYYRMTGRNVLHALGFDAFGLPAEQYAIQTGTHPRTRTEANIVNFRRQLGRLGLGHDARRSFSTTDVDFYKWTQWIFLQIFNAWFDPAANKARPIAELIAEFDAGTSDGRSTAGPGRSSTPTSAPTWSTPIGWSTWPTRWSTGARVWARCWPTRKSPPTAAATAGNFPVFRKRLRQWMMRITAYSDRLLDDLDLLDWPDKVKAMQRNWIGRSTGASVQFGTDAGDIEVFTTRPDTLFGATYMVLAPGTRTGRPAGRRGMADGVDERWTFGAATPVAAVAAYRAAIAAKSDLERQENKSKTGVFLGAYATNPANGQQVPVFIADYVLAGYGTGAIMAVPAGTSGTGTSPPSSACRSWKWSAGRSGATGMSRRDVSEAAYSGDGTAGQLGLPRRHERRRRQGGDDRAAGRRRPGPGSGSSTSCGTGCSPGSGTGVSRSRSSTTPTAARTVCPNRCCPSNCLTCRTIRRCSSIPTTPTASRRHRWPRSPTG